MNDDLSGADLAGKDLRGMDYQQSSFRGADLSGADLRGVDLSGSDLTGAVLTNTDLRGANLRMVDLRGTDLSRALLDGADLRGAWCDVGTIIPDPDLFAQMQGLCVRIRSQAHSGEDPVSRIRSGVTPTPYHRFAATGDGSRVRREGGCESQGIGIHGPSKEEAGSQR